MAGVEALLQRLLPGTLDMPSRVQPDPAHRDWNTIVCFSCGKSGHGVSRCPGMNETFRYMLPGWTAEKSDALASGLSGASPGARRRLIWGGGSAIGSVINFDRGCHLRMLWRTIWTWVNCGDARSHAVRYGRGPPRIVYIATAR